MLDIWRRDELEELEAMVVAARALIASRDRWVQGREASSAAGRTLRLVDDPRAVKWCAVGAARLVSQQVVAGDQYFQAMILLLQDAGGRLVGCSDIPTVNDTRGPRAAVHETVLALYDDALAVVREHLSSHAPGESVALARGMEGEWGGEYCTNRASGG